MLNGEWLGSKPLAADAWPRTGRVAFESGTLQAVGRNKGRVAARHELRTAGKAAKIVLAADRTRLANGWDDVAFVTAGVVDADGVMVPGAAPLVTFRVTGPDAIVAGDNADNAGHEPFQASERHAFEGWCLAILKAMAAGRVTVTASVAGLAASSITIEAGER